MYPGFDCYENKFNNVYTRARSLAATRAMTILRFVFFMLLKAKVMKLLIWQSFKTSQANSSESISITSPLSVVPNS